MEKEKMLKEQQQVKEEVKTEVQGDVKEKVGDPLVKKEIVKVKVENFNSATFQSKFVF